MLNRWKFFQQRARFDIARGRASRDRNGHMTIQTPQRQIYVRCNFCDGVRMKTLTSSLLTLNPCESPSLLYMVANTLFSCLNRVSHIIQSFPTPALKMANTNNHNSHLNHSPPIVPTTTIAIPGNLLFVLSVLNLYLGVPFVFYILVHQITKEQKLASKCCQWMKN